MFRKTVNQKIEKIERNAPCWCGSGKKYKTCHMQFDEKLKKFAMAGYIVPEPRSKASKRARSSTGRAWIT